MVHQQRRSGRFGLLCVSLLVGTLAFASGSALAKVAGSAHDFRATAEGGANSAYPNLSTLAGKSPCRVCHESHPAQEVEALFAEDFGWAPTRRISLPSSGLCMSCHDGQANFGTGAIDSIKDPGKVIAKRHRRHRVEFFYPAPEGFIRTPGQVVTDETGHSYVLGTDGTRLPLYKDAKSGRLKGGCPTCHNPHQPGENRLFLRTASAKELCRVCHNR